MRLGIGIGLNNFRKTGTGGTGPIISAPSQFTAGQWTLADSPSAGGDTLSLNVTELPSNGGSAITALQYSVGGGAAQTLSGVGTGARLITVLASTAASVELWAVNAIGSGARSTAKVATPTVAAASTLREQIEGLRDGVTPNGAQAGTYKVLGVDALPTGMTYNAGTGAVTIGAAFSGDLSYWDFTGKSLVVQGQIGTISNCKFGEPLGSPAGKLYYVDVYLTGAIDTISYCTFEGPYTFGGSGTAINCRSAGTGASFSAGNIRYMHHNRFVGLTSDHTKINGCADAGGQIIEWNYYGPTVNLPNEPTDYSSGTSYALGYAAKDAATGYVYLSLSDGNVGNPLPVSASKVAATAYWQGVDPHADQITTVAAIGDGITIRRNLFDNTNDPPNALGPYPAIGVTNALRISRNSGTDYLLNRVEIAENVIYKGGLSQAYPIQVYDGGQDNFNGPINFTDNWFGANANGLYFHASSNGWVDAWSNNRDYATDAVIAGPTLRSRTHVIGIMGQSQEEYLLNPGPTYRQITQPTLSASNMIVWNDAGAGPIKTVVSPTTVAAGSVNPAMAAMADFLDFARSGHTFVIADLSVAGTSRFNLFNDADIGRSWSDFAAMLTAVEADAGPLQHVFDRWIGSDSSSAKTFKESFSPFYFKQRWGGSAFALGAANPDAAVYPSVTVDHCLWDYTAATDAKGDGVFTRAGTKLHMLGWPTFNDAPSDVEARNVTTTNAGANITRANQLDRGARDGWLAFYNDSRVQTFAGSFGPSSHIANLNGDVHPITTDPDGQILSMWPLAVAALNASGMTVREPTILATAAAIDGSYVDVTVDLPNGGTLTTLRALESRAAPATEPPHYQPVMGFEIRRVGDADNQRRAVFKTTETSYPAAYRGAVTISDSGTGTAPSRTGKIRITPTTAFSTGDILEFLRGDASASLFDPRDYTAKLWANFPIEHIPSLYDATALYKFPGVAVRPQPAAMALTVSAPDVTAPILSGVSVAKTATTATLAWSTNEANGSAYWLVDTNPTRTSAQVVAGGGSGSGSRAVAATGAQAAFSATGLSAASAYYYHIVHVDAASNASAVSSVGFTTDAAAAAFSSKTDTADAYLTGPSLGSGVVAVTAVFDINLPDGLGTSGAELIEYLSTTFRAVVDFRSGRRGITLTIEDSGGAKIFGSPVVTADGAMPAGRHTFVMSASLDSDGSKTALLNAWVDGVSVYSATPVTSATGLFDSVRTLELLNGSFACDVYEISIYAGTHAQGYTSTGSVTGLTQIRTVSGAAANFNAPSGGLVKAGTDSFT